MKAKVFDVATHRIGNEAPSEALESQLNQFLAQHQTVQIHSVQMNSVVLPPMPHAMPKSDAGQPSIVIFCTVFYTD